jgi:hypothetical protein
LYFNDTVSGQQDRLKSVIQIPGAFFVSLQYSILSVENHGTGLYHGSSVDLFLVDSGNSVGVWEANMNGSYGFNAKAVVGGSTIGIPDWVLTSVTSGMLGIGYNGLVGDAGQATAWYNDGSGWTQLGTFAPHFAGNPRIVILGYDEWGNSLSFKVSNVEIVPLPPSLLLLAPGLVGLAAVRRRFKK